MGPTRPRILVLFPSHWDRRHLGRRSIQERYEVVFYDRTLWTFPVGFFRALTFDPVAYIDKVARHAADGGFDGILSTDEYVGCAVAAAVAQRLGWPTIDPATVVGMQHKYTSRLLQQECVPEVVPDFQHMPVPPPPESELSLTFPFFVKPVRGSFSIFAAKVGSYQELRRHLDIDVFWRAGLRNMLRPPARLLRHFTSDATDVGGFIAEATLDGVQLCIDGCVHDGEVHLMGVVDAVMFPGTIAFERFQYPSRLPPDVQTRIAAVVRRLVEGLRILHGQFNAELVYDAARDSIGLIEIHPRMSYQFADLYADVDGVDIYDQLLSLTVGERPNLGAVGGAYRHSASLVIRKFGGSRITTLPDEGDLSAFRDRYPNARVEIYAKKGSMNPEMRAMGSYRCALVNVAANSAGEISTIRADVESLLAFEVA